MVATGGLVTVHAHPDDETLATGALLATWAAAGLPTTVVTCTRGELGEVIGAELAHLEGDGPALARHREGELASALAALGVRDHVFLDQVDAVPVDATAVDAPGARRFSDSGMAWAGVGQAGSLDVLPPDAFVAVPVDDAAGRLARVLRERRPDVVATYEPGGGYGHPDHVRAHDVTMRAAELAADPAWAPHVGEPFRVPVVLWAACGERALRAAYRELGERDATSSTPAASVGLTLPDPFGPLPSVVVPDRSASSPVQTSPDLEVDVAPVLERVLAAMHAHATQIQAARAFGDVAAGGVVLGRYALSNGVLAPILAAESYRSAPGSHAQDISWPAGSRRVDG